jgi:hypothetical protein
LFDAGTCALKTDPGRMFGFLHFSKEVERERRAGSVKSRLLAFLKKPGSGN